MQTRHHRKWAAPIAIAWLVSTGGLRGDQASPQARQEREPPRFRVAADGVRIDAVATDRDGRIVSDLTAADIEVRQDRKRQRLMFVQFVPVESGPPAPAPAVPAAIEADLLTPPKPASRPAPVKKEEVQRTLAIVIDDLSLSFESLQNTQKALHAFVDRELRPTDLVALVRTGGSIGGLQPFTTDRRFLHDTIDRLRWTAKSGQGVEPFEPVNKWTTFDSRHGMGDITDFKSVNVSRSAVKAAGTLGALNLIVRGTKEMPGRKAIVFVSEGFTIPPPGEKPWVRDALDRVIEQAARAGVVIYGLDCRSLQSSMLLASDNLKTGGIAPDQMEQGVRGDYSGRYRFNIDTQEGMSYLAEETGGFAVLNTNALGSGLARITDDIRGYYVIGYAPEAGTFVGKGKKPSLHKISIKSLRPGVRIRTRKEFLGVADPQEITAAKTPAQELVHTATSPFAATDIDLRATTLPGHSKDLGSFVRVLLHVDARALAFVADDTGKKTASADVLGMVFNHDGIEVAHLSTGFSVALSNEGARDALRDGLAYSLRIPIPRAGGYQVRFAIRDRQTGSLGSAGEYVVVEDIAHGAFALSGIVLQSDDGKAAAPSEGSSQAGLAPGLATRVYPRGSRLTYEYEIYNASGPVVATMTIWRGAEKVLAAAPATLVPPHGAERQFAAGGGFRLGDALPPGSYLLQIVGTVVGPKEVPKGTAAQWIDFDVR